MKRILSLLVLMFCLFCLSSEAETREMQDFTVQTLDGSFHLSEVLQEKKMVLINFFASWCGPCKMEFPYMEEAYKQYADSVAVLALSVEPNDTTDVLRSYAEENGLSFSVGSDAVAGISAQFDTSAIPVTVVVDRFGQIVLEEAGARSSADDFIHLFDYMTSDYYTKSVPLNGFPSGRADAESETPEKLAEALGEGITFRNPESPFVWPMKTATDGDRLVLQSTAPLESGAISSLTVQASAHEGDALAFEYRTDSTPGVNLLTVNTAENAPVFVFGGKSDWAGHAISLHEGENTLTFSFTVALPFSQSETAFLDSFRLLSGEEAAAALAANPVYPVSEQLTLHAGNAVPLSFDDPSSVLPFVFGPSELCLVEDPTARITLTLPENVDPHQMVFYAPYSGTLTSPASMLTDGTYSIEVAMPADDASTSAIANVLLYASIEDAMDDNPIQSLTVFPGRKSIDALISYLAGYGFTVSLKE